MSAGPEQSGAFVFTDADGLPEAVIDLAELAAARSAAAAQLCDHQDPSALVVLDLLQTYAPGDPFARFTVSCGMAAAAARRFQALVERVGRVDPALARSLRDDVAATADQFGHRHHKGESGHGGEAR